MRRLVFCTLITGPAFAFLFFAMPVHSANRLLIVDVTIISAEILNPLRGTSVLIENGITTEIGEYIDDRLADKIIDDKGRFLTSWLIDSHVRLGGSVGMRGEQTH